MNKNQKRVLMMVIAVIVVMFLYPLCHFLAPNGLVYNMGYGWIIDPPKFGEIRTSVDVPMLMIQWIGVLIVGGLAFCLAKNSPQKLQGFSSNSKNESTLPEQQNVAASIRPVSKAPTQNKAPPAGVGGWLGLLIVGMMFIGPLFGALRINGEFLMIEKKFSAFVSLDQWKTFKTATWWIFLCLSVVNVYGGACLSAGKYCYFVKQAKIILWITGPVSYFAFGFLLPKIVLGEFGTLDGEWTGGFIASIIVTSIWTVYLSRSKRVRNTYYW